MDQATHNKIVSFIWGIADDVLRDLFKRGKYPDVILPMCVLRRLDTVLLETHQAVLETKAMLDDAGITEQRQALCDAAGQAFYNTSKFTLRDLQSRNSQQQLRQDFEDYLDGFSPNVQDILENFKFRNQIPTLSKADALGLLIEKFCNPDINFSSKPVLNGDGSIRHPAMDNHSMGTIFEELVRKFNEDNNEEAGEHWTPRDAVKLMARLIFQPIASKIKPGSYELYDGACGTGGMLTVAEETLLELAGGESSGVKTYLYGQEINPETFAICKETSKKDSSNLDKSKYKLVRPRDLAYNKMRAWQGAIGVSKFTGIISPAYVVMRPHIASVVPRYFHFLYRTPAFAKEAERWSYGITSDMWSLRPEHFKMIYTLVPPPDEQELIVRFLDWASVKLGKAIAAKRKVIGLLEEQKQEIIHRAVTRGLDDTVSLKPSGFEWLGDVPEHWKIMRIKNLLSGIDYGTSENARGEGHIRVLNMGHIKSGRVQIPANGSLRAMPLGLELRSHDLLFNRTNSPELVGKVGIFLGTEADRVTFASYLVRLRPKADHNPFWLNYVLNSVGFWHYARRQAFVSLHQANLNSTRYSQMSIPVPPASEQQLIAEALRAETASFDNAISANEHEIELIREYRTRLIADVVTGKLDVRKFAQTLPADVAEEAAELTSSELGDDEFTDSDDELADELAREPS